MDAGARGTTSCLYEGTVRHRRRAPGREFRYRLALAYIDLDELPTLLGGRLVDVRPGLLRFRHEDYHGSAASPALPLDEAVRHTVEAHTGERPAGPIRLLTQLRSWGRCFNPASFYYCFSPDGTRIEHLLTEVTNTPWGERVAYVASAGGTDGPVLHGAFAKQMHVSPLMGMDQTYALNAALPGQTLSLHIASAERDEPVFDATLSLTRAELTRSSARSLALRYPFETARVFTLIYTQALRAKLAGATYYSHPSAGGAA